MRDEWDWDLGLGCTDCDASLWEDDRAFSFAVRAYLCQDCAARRGGIFDPELEAWTTPPDVRDIAPEESSPGLPHVRPPRGTNDDCRTSYIVPARPPAD